MLVAELALLSHLNGWNVELDELKAAHDSMMPMHKSAALCTGQFQPWAADVILSPATPILLKM